MVKKLCLSVVVTVPAGDVFLDAFEAGGAEGVVRGEGGLGSGRVEADDPAGGAGFLELESDGVEEDAAAAAEVEGVLDGGPVRDGGDDALRHLPVEGDGGVEEVGGGEEEADGGEGGDGAGESGGEAGGGRAGEEVALKEEADGLEVEEEDDGEGSEAHGVDKEEHRRLPVVHAVDRVDLRPISPRFPHLYIPIN